MREQDITFLVSAKGPEAKAKMDCLIGYARLLGDISIRRVGEEESEIPTTTVKATAELLSALLSMPGPYRQNWSRHIRKKRGGPINQGAVTRVIGEWYTREHPDEEIAERSMLVRVNRALTGDVLTLETLNLFINAFDFDEAHAEQLRTTLHPSGRPLDKPSTEND